MPGSPPTNKTEPRTKPPPVTRSNSAKPEGRRGASRASPASGSHGKNPAPPGLRPRACRTTLSSLRVFHSPQASHFPCQRLNAPPQFWQTKVKLRFDIENRRGIAGVYAKAQMRTIQEHF